MAYEVFIGNFPLWKFLSVEVSRGSRPLGTLGFTFLFENPMINDS